MSCVPATPGRSTPAPPTSSEREPKSEVEELVLEEVPDIDYDSIGGLVNQIDQIRDAVELPYLHPELFKEHELKLPKGVLLDRPPGEIGTLIAKAKKNLWPRSFSLRQEGKSYFLNIKGPQLLNKYVGETKRKSRRASPGLRKTRRMCRSVSPTYLLSSSGPLMLRK